MPCVQQKGSAPCKNVLVACSCSGLHAVAFVGLVAFVISVVSRSTKVVLSLLQVLDLSEVKKRGKAGSTQPLEEGRNTIAMGAPANISAMQLN